MSKKVKRRYKTTKISKKHQVTIPAPAFRTAGLEPGDTLRAEADGAGRVILTRVDELIDRYCGAFSTSGELRKEVGGLKDEWR